MLRSNCRCTKTALSQVLGHNSACGRTLLRKMLRHNGARIQGDGKRSINLRECKALCQYRMFLFENHGSDFTILE